MGIFDHSSRSAFVRSHTDVGQEGLALSLCSNSSQRCSVGLKSGLCAGQSSSSTPNSLSMSLWTLLYALVHSYVGTGRGHPQTVPTKLEAWNCPTSLGMLKHTEFLSLELKVQTQLLKNNPNHNPPSTKLHTWHNAVRLFFWQPPNSDLSIRLLDGEA